MIKKNMKMVSKNSYYWNSNVLTTKCKQICTLSNKTHPICAMKG
jgi:hypothetical protein